MRMENLIKITVERELEKRREQQQQDHDSSLTVHDFMFVCVLAALREQGFFALAQRQRAEDPLPLLSASLPLCPFERLALEQTGRGRRIWSVPLSHALSPDTVYLLQAVASSSDGLTLVVATTVVQLTCSDWVERRPSTGGDRPTAAWQLIPSKTTSFQQLIQKKIFFPLIPLLQDDGGGTGTATTSRQRSSPQQHQQQQQPPQPQPQPPFSIGGHDFLPPLGLGGGGSGGPPPGNLIGPNHPSFGQGPGSRFGERYDPVGFGEPDPDHLQMPGFMGGPNSRRRRGGGPDDDFHGGSGFGNSFL